MDPRPQEHPSLGPANKKHWKDWPNAAAFNYSQDHRIPIKIDIQGLFPNYVAGTLYRTGPNAYKLARKQADSGMVSVSHWFDGFTTVHKFEILSDQGQDCHEIRYSSYCHVDERMERARETGKLDGITFGQKRDPCDSLYRKFKSAFAPQAVKNPLGSNIGVALRETLPAEASTIADAAKRRLMTVVTDNNAAKTFDMDTLEPLAVTTQDILHEALSGPISGAHAAHDPETGDIFNYNLKFGMIPGYKIFKTTLAGDTTILANVWGPDIKGAYIHSISLTRNFVILCIWPAYYRHLGLSILYERNLLEAMHFDNSASTMWVVVDRHRGRGVVKKFKSSAFFCFHTVNAWETSGKTSDTVDVICELVEFQNMDILHRFYYQNLVSDQSGVTERNPETDTPRLTRYKLSQISTTGEGFVGNAQEALKVMDTVSGDLPRINPLYVFKQHRFVYTVLDRGNSSFLDGIGKTDTQTGQTLVWEAARHTPGEPIFLPAPGTDVDEDEGAVLCVVLDGDVGSSYLLCLDAKTMKEIGRASVGVPVGFGFHGTHLSIQGTSHRP